MLHVTCNAYGMAGFGMTFGGSLEEFLGGALFVFFAVQTDLSAKYK